MTTVKNSNINIISGSIFKKKRSQFIIFASYILSFIFIVLTICPLSLNAQNQSKIDSLILSISYSTSEDKKLNSLLELASQLQDNNPKQAL